MTIHETLFKKSYLKAAQYISYDPETGEIKHLKRKDANPRLDKDGYYVIKIKTKIYRVHRLAWAKYHDQEPSLMIDHINRNKIDNRIKNLRHVSCQVNNLNVDRKPNKETGYIGIYLDSITKGLIAKYTTRINGKTYRFRELKEAVSLREQYKRAV